MTFSRTQKITAFITLLFCLFIFTLPAAASQVAPAPGSRSVVTVDISAPKQLKAALGEGNRAVSLTWQAVKVASGYEIQRSLSPESGFVVIAKVKRNITTYDDASILPEKTYYYRVQSYVTPKSGAAQYSAGYSPVASAKWIGITAVSLTKSTYSAVVGETFTLKASVYPSGASNTAFTWSSSAPDIASVSQSGVVLVLKGGSVRITASTVGDGFKAYCDVTITAAIQNPARKDYGGQGLVTFVYTGGQLAAYQYALPLHEAYNIPAVFAITTEYVAQQSRYPGAMTDASVADAYKRGAEIASRGHSVAGVTPTNVDEMRYEMQESLRLLQKAGANVQSFVAPYDKFNANMQRLAGDYFLEVLTTQPKMNALPVSDPYTLYTAIEIDDKTSFKQIKKSIDEAARKRRWCIVSVSDVTNKSTKEGAVSAALLEQTLSYIVSIGRNKLMPVNLIDGVAFTKTDR